MKRTRRGRSQPAQLAFEALSIEGGLLSPEWLSKVAQLAATHQSESDYRILKGLNLRDEIGRYWRIAQAYWSELTTGRARSADPSALAERFVLGLLKDSFGFSSIKKLEPITLAERVYPIGHSAIGTRVPIVIAPAASGLDTLAQSFADEKRRRSAFGLVQEYLNADDAALWGIVTDGHTLRIARDNASLTRPAWIEADLARMFTEERFADFAALWLLAHETRFGEADQPVHECPLETWREAGREQGTRARDKLRNGVEDALAALGQGFLAHPSNQALRASLQSGELPTKDFFNQLLRLVYRIIFLLTVEERGLLHPDGTDEKAKALYADGYSLRRLRERAVKRSAHDRFADLWEATKIVFAGLATSEPRLGLPALAGIFARTQCPALDGAKLENRHLLLAVFKLSWIRDDASLSRVNWRDMGPEELGSVYESLLELVPQITKDGRQFTFASGGETKGNARKTSGSYYTPDSLVQVLLDSALEPVIESTVAANPEKPVEALLQLSIVDPACGSGHFLLAAARRLAAHVARRQANGTPSAAEYRHALRQVIGHCIYGVDLNPMAVELCKVSLWMEAVEPGLPLTFLNSHIQHGNALLGTTPELMAKGIPDAAWDPIEGDDKKVASALKKRNKSGAGGQRGLGLFGTDPAAEREAVAKAVTELEGASDADVAALAKKESRWDGILGSPEYRHQKLVADAWCAAFVWPKQAGASAHAAPTNELWRQLRDGQAAPAVTTKTVGELAEQYRFFHWHLQYPQVFARGGFDVVLGNPPWERVAFEEVPFFAARDPQVAAATTTAERERLIDALRMGSPTLHAEYMRELRRAGAEDSFFGASGRFELSARGRTNTFALFVDVAAALVSDVGRAGLVVPTALATDTPMKDFWAYLMRTRRVALLADFENRGRFFPSVHNSYKFSLLTLVGAGHPVAAKVGFFLSDPRDALRDDALLTIHAEELLRLNPDTGLMPVCRSTRDLHLLRSFYRVGVAPKASNPAWVWLTSAGSSDAWVHRRALEDRAHESIVPLFEAKLMHQFDHRFASFETSESAEGLRQEAAPEPVGAHHEDPRFTVKTRYYIASSLAGDHLRRKTPYSSCLLVYRDLADNRALRTMIATILPYGAALQPLNGITIRDGHDAAFLVANLNAFACDFVTRLKTPGLHVNVTTFNQLPLLPKALAHAEGAWCPAAVTTGSWVLARVLELTYTAWDLEPFALDVGYDGPPFRWNPERRFLLRCELDAAFFHLYGLSRDDTDYVMDTFPIVRKHDEKAHGEYRTKRVILEIYDAMAEAARTGNPYQTRLDPPPADPRVAHPPREGGKVIPLPVRPLRPLPVVPATLRRDVPAWSPDLLPAVATKTGLAASAGRWGTTLTGVDLGIAALAAVLRNVGGPASRDEVERAVVLAALPGLLHSKFDTRTAATWRRAIGTANVNLTSIAALSIPWAEVLRRAAIEHLLAIDADGRWRAGADIADAPSDVLDARALVALSWLESVSGAATEDADLVTQLEALRAA